MRFYTEMRYDGTNAEIRAQLLAEAIQGPQKYPTEYLRPHFDNNGGKDHPVLGDFILIAGQTLS